MIELVAVKRIGDQVGTFEPGQRFFIHDMVRAQLLINAGDAKRFENRWEGLDWRGQTVVIMASGPSLNEKQCERVKEWGGKSIAINTSFRIAPWATVLYACDARWWKLHHAEACQVFKGQFWSQDKDSVTVDLNIRHIPSQRGAGLCKQMGVINQGNNSGYQAIGLAQQAGATRIILLGYDMHEKGGSHWHGDHPSTLNTKPNFPLWIDNFRVLAVDLKKEGIDVVNCSPGTSLPCFPKMSLEKALA